MVKFFCPECRQYALEVSNTIRVKPRSPESTEESVQSLSCPTCNFKAIGIYRETRAFALDEYGMDHTCYPLRDDSSFENIDDLLKQAEKNEEKQDELNRLYHNGFDCGQIKINWSEPFPIKPQA